MSDGLVDPSEFPARSRDLDVEVIRGSARGLRGLGAKLVGHTDVIAGRWNGLAPCYQAPESEQVLALMGPVAIAGREVNEVYGSVARLLDVYADELEVVKPRLADLERRAQAFRDKVKGGIEKSVYEEQPFAATIIGPGTVTVSADIVYEQVTIPWYEDTASVEKNKDLLREHANLIEQISASAGSCADGISALNRSLGGMCLAPAARITSDQVMAMQGQAFGSPREEDRNCIEQTGDGFYDFGTGLASGAGSLVLGYDPATGGFWTSEGYGQAWGGLVNLVGSLAVIGVPSILAGTLAPESGLGRWVNERHRVAGTAITSLIGYDLNAQLDGGDGWQQWKDNGWQTGTSTLLNIGTFFIPVAGQVGAGAKTVAGARAVTAATAAAEVVTAGGSWIIRGTQLATKTASALLHGKPWAEVIGLTRTTQGIRLGGAGLNANALTAINNLTPPHPKTLTTLSEAITLRPHNTKPNVHTPEAHAPEVRGSETRLSEQAIRAGNESWINQAPITEPSAARRANHTQTPVHAKPEHLAPQRELATVGARPGETTNTAKTTTPHTDTPGTGGSHGSRTSEPSRNQSGTLPGTPEGPGNGGHGSDTPNGPRPGPQGRGGPGYDSSNRFGPTPKTHQPNPDNPGMKPDGPDTKPEGSAAGHGTTPDGPTAGRGTTSDGTVAPEGLGRGEKVHPESGRPLWDEKVSPKFTVKQSEMGNPPYTVKDVQDALNKAPVNELGQPVDHRTGLALRNPTADTGRGWQMAIDIETGDWVAQNPGGGRPTTDWNPRGEPNSYGYDANGDLMPYADYRSRPKYAPGQVEEVWKKASDAWEKDANGIWQRDPAIPDEVTVECSDGSRRKVIWDPTLSPTAGRSGPDGWDMGHTSDAKYSELHEQYLNHEISKEKFLADFHNPDHYTVEDPSRNRSHVDE